MSRVASLFVAAAFIAFMVYLQGQKGIVSGIYYLALPMACIWLSDVMGDFTETRMGRIAGPEITKATPGCIVHVAGWLLLIVVVITKVYLYLSITG